MLVIGSCVNPSPVLAFQMLGVSPLCRSNNLLCLLCQNVWLLVTHPVLSAFQAFQALRLALEQQYLSRCSCSKTTEGVKVDVSSRFEQASVDSQNNMEARGPQRAGLTVQMRTCKLLPRHW